MWITHLLIRGDAKVVTWKKEEVHSKCSEASDSCFLCIDAKGQIINNELAPNELKQFIDPIDYNPKWLEVEINTR